MLAIIIEELLVINIIFKHVSCCGYYGGLYDICYLVFYLT